MGDWNKSQPSASANLLPYALPLDRNVNLSRFIETFTSSNHEVLHGVQEVKKSMRQLCERIEMEIPPDEVGKISVMNNSLAVLSAQQMQLVDLMRSMSEQLRLLQSMSVQIQQADNPYPSGCEDYEPKEEETSMDESFSMVNRRRMAKKEAGRGIAAREI
ncbi:unnamed protein product [Prunus brigantina]